jgi:fatty acid desaturase
VYSYSTSRRDRRMVRPITVLIIALYNLSLFAGTAYLIIEYDWSPWWFLLTVLVMGMYKHKDD